MSFAFCTDLDLGLASEGERVAAPSLLRASPLSFERDASRVSRVGGGVRGQGVQSSGKCARGGVSKEECEEVDEPG